MDIFTRLPYVSLFFLYPRLVAFPFSFLLADLAPAVAPRYYIHSLLSIWIPDSFRIRRLWTLCFPFLHIPTLCVAYNVSLRARTRAPLFPILFMCVFGQPWPILRLVFVSVRVSSSLSLSDPTSAIDTRHRHLRTHAFRSFVTSLPLTFRSRCLTPMVVGITTHVHWPLSLLRFSPLRFYFTFAHYRTHAQTSPLPFSTIVEAPFTDHLPSSYATDTRYHVVVLTMPLRDHVTLHVTLGPEMYRHP